MQRFGKRWIVLVSIFMALLISTGCSKKQEYPNVTFNDVELSSSSVGRPEQQAVLVKPDGTEVPVDVTISSAVVAQTPPYDGAVVFSEAITMDNELGVAAKCIKAVSERDLQTLADFNLLSCTPESVEGVHNFLGDLYANGFEGLWLSVGESNEYNFQINASNAGFATSFQVIKLNDGWKVPYLPGMTLPTLSEDNSGNSADLSSSSSLNSSSSSVG